MVIFIKRVTPSPEKLVGSNIWENRRSLFPHALTQVPWSRPLPTAVTPTLQHAQGLLEAQGWTQDTTGKVCLVAHPLPIPQSPLPGGTWRPQLACGRS
ncbi:MAG: hypothetical protein F6K30_20475 [Cyanothece sp. SIO2G6]|nr:hypothetical protein [Cyanothece sp. SIO2G6]